MNRRTNLDQIVKRKLLFFLITLLLIVWEIFPVEIPLIRNIPPTKNRVSLTRNLNIYEKENGKFYFRYPRSIKVDTDGNIFLLDSNRILKFDKNGNFITNLVPSGVGPGEAINVENFLLDGKNIVIHSQQMPKIMCKDENGKILKETRVPRSGSKELIYYKDDPYFFDMKKPDFNGDTDGSIINITWNLYKEKIDYNYFTYVYSVARKTYYMKVGSAFGCDYDSPLITAYISDKFLVVNNTATYGLKIIDIKQNKIKKEFIVSYDRKIDPNAGIVKYEINGKKFTPPVKKYKPDIKTLLVHKNTIWVVTSTADSQNCTRVDTFDTEGQFKDTFFLNLPGRQSFDSFTACISGDNFYLAEFPDDGEPAIFRYAIKTMPSI